MPRDLADVLHHLIPEADPSAPAAGAPAAETRAPAAETSAPGARPAPSAVAAGLPILAVPIGDRDAVRAAFLWNLTVEAARLGAGATLVAPASDRGRGLWPDGDELPLGARLVWVEANDLAGLARTVEPVAARCRAGEAGGLVLVRVPPRWLRNPRDGARLLRWTLLLSSSEPRDLLESYGLTKLVSRVAPGARVGVTIHGTHRRGEARVAFSRLAEVSRRRLGNAPRSYGLLVDDLQVYRAALARRPIGLVHPQGPAARSLCDVAELLLSDARDGERDDG